MTNNSFINELSQLRPNSTFLVLKGYRNSYSEVSDYNIVFNVNYQNALQKSINFLQNYTPLSSLEIQAKDELIASYQKSLTKMETIPFEELEDNYLHFKDDNGDYIKGVKYHLKSDTIHLYGFVVHKKIIIPGNYPQVNKRELTLVKDKLSKLTIVSKFRQFKIVPEQLDYIKVNKLTIFPE